MVGAKSVHPGGRARGARGWVFVHSPSYKRFLFREGSISVIGTVESVDNCHIGPVGRGARVCMTGGASLSGIPRVCGQNLLFARRPPSVHRSCPVIPRRSTAFGDENCHSRWPIRVCENTQDRRVSLDPGSRVVVLAGRIRVDATVTIRSGSGDATPASPPSLRDPRQKPRRSPVTYETRLPCEGTRGAWRTEEKDGQPTARCLMRAVSSWTWSYTLRRSAISLRILRSAYMTVVWSRSNVSPIFGSDRSVSSRHRYIEI